MKIYDISLLSGRNIYSHNPIVRLTVDLEDLNDKTTKDFEGFSDKLVELFPNLIEHYCGLGYRGGFIERLKEGTYFGHVLEHLSLELQSVLGYRVFYGKTRLKEEPSIYTVVFESGNSNVAIECAKKAQFIIESIINNKQFDISVIIENLKTTKNQYELGPSTKAIFDEAKKRGIPVKRLGNESILELGYGKYSRLVQASITDSTSSISVDMACNKQLTKEILEENNIPVPFGDIAYTVDDAVNIAHSIGYPVVLKPLNGNQGKGVVVNLNSDNEVKEAYKIPEQFSECILVEKYVDGKDYRVLVVGDKVSAVAERIPATVVGDGIHSVTELVDIENNNPLRGEGHEKPLTKIKLDDVAVNYLKRNGIDINFTPAVGQEIKLRDNGNLSTGGTAVECTRLIHPENARIAVQASKAIGLDIAGIDFKSSDISIPITESNGHVIEVNAAPGLRMHLHPGHGNAINVASDILDLMYPDNAQSSIPIVAITGTNGKTTTTRLIKHILSLSGKTVGMTSTSGVYLNDKCILKGDNTGPFSAKLVLGNKNVDAAVLEVARGGIVKRGLGYDLADVGIVTNISEDHLGLDGVDTLEDLAYVKSLITESVKPNGYSVLNADDGMVDYFIERARGNIILFSKSNTNKKLDNHLSKNGIGVYVKDNKITIRTLNESIELIDINDIPITFNGALECNIENALAAVSALYGLDVPLEFIVKGLQTFKPDINMNPGRFNIFEVNNFKVMLDYGHNIGGYEEVRKFIEKLDISRVIGVIGVPGDRTDESTAKVAELCTKMFSKIYIKEDIDLRGRKPGEVAGIMYNSIINTGFNPHSVQIILSETEALKNAMIDAKNGDLVILFYEELEPAVKLVNQMKEMFENNKVIELIPTITQNNNDLAPSISIENTSIQDEVVNQN